MNVANASADTQQCPRFPPWLVACLVMVALASVAMLFLIPRDFMPYWGLLNNFVDLNVYRWGGRYIWEGLPLYQESLRAAPWDPARHPMAWTYTPFAALLSLPLSLIGLRTMENLWFLASIGSMVYIAWRMLVWLGYRQDRRLLWVATLFAAIMLFTEPFRTSLWLGQVNILLLTLVILDASAPTSRLRGWATGVAAGIKLTPGFLWAHYAVTRQWHYLITGLLSFSATVGVGALVAPRDSLHYWSGGLLRTDRVGEMDSPSNQSINGILSHFIFDGQNPPLWAWFIAASSCAAIGLLVAMRLHRSGEPQLAFVLSGMTGAMASPFSWGHHWVWFLPLMVVVVHLLHTRIHHGWALLAWILPFTLYFLIGAWVDYFPNSDQPEGYWVATGWFMSREALSGPLWILLREPYVAVWLATVIAGVLLTRRRRNTPVNSSANGTVGL